MEGLAEFLKQGLPGFSPLPFYEKHTDSLIVYFEDSRSYSDRVNAHLTVFRSIDDDSLVGLEIKRLKTIIKASQGKLCAVGTGMSNTGTPFSRAAHGKLITIADELLRIESRLNGAGLVCDNNEEAIARALVRNANKIKEAAGELHAECERLVGLMRDIGDVI